MYDDDRPLSDNERRRILNDIADTWVHLSRTLGKPITAVQAIELALDIDTAARRDRLNRRQESIRRLMSQSRPAEPQGDPEE